MGLGQLVGTVGGAVLGQGPGAAIGGSIGGSLDSMFGGKSPNRYGQVSGFTLEELQALRKRNKRRRELYNPIENKALTELEMIQSGQDPATLTGDIASGIAGAEQTYGNMVDQVTGQYAKMGRAGGAMTKYNLAGLGMDKMKTILGMKKSARLNAYNRAMKLAGFASAGGRQESSAPLLNTMSGIAGNQTRMDEAGRTRDLLGGAILTKGVSAGMDWWGAKDGGGYTPTSDPNAETTYGFSPELTDIKYQLGS